LLALKVHYAAEECVGDKVEMIIGGNEAFKSAYWITQKEQ